jgi:hypothetical protein
VAVLVWQDHFVNRSEYRFPVILDRSKLGFKEMIENLRWAKEHCNGRVNIIIARAAKHDPVTQERVIANCNPRPDLEMEIRDLDEATGAYTGIIRPAVV